MAPSWLDKRRGCSRGFDEARTRNTTGQVLTHCATSGGTAEEDVSGAVASLANSESNCEPREEIDTMLKSDEKWRKIIV
jgi:hypothetical protein